MVEQGVTSQKKRSTASDLKLELIEYVDKRVSDNTARDRDFIRYSITITLGIVGAIVAAAATILTLIGFRTFDDIKNKVNDLAKTTIERQIQEIDPKDTLRKKLENLYAQSLIKALTAESAVGSTEDLSFLLSYILRDDTPASVFANGLAALERSYTDNMGADFADRLLIYLNSHAGQYNRISENSAKIAATINFFAERHYPYAMPAVRKWMADTDTVPQVRIAVVSYAASIRDQESLSEIASLANGRDLRLSTVALEALSAIDPASSVLSTWASHLTNFGSGEEVQRANEVLKTLCQNDVESLYFRSNYDVLGRFSMAKSENSAQDYATRISLARDVMNSLIKAKYTFYISRELSYARPDIIQAEQAADDDNQINSAYVESTPFSTCLYLAKDILSSVFQGGHPDLLADAIRFFTVYDRNTDMPWVVPFITLEKGVRIILDDGNILDNTISSAAIFRVEKGAKDRRILVGFLRASGDRPWGYVAKFENLEKAKVSLGFRQGGLYYSR